jgi:hypothetical protein
MTPESGPPPDDATPPAAPARLGKLATAASFWEVLRIPYNTILALCFFVWVVASWPHFRGAMSLIHVLQLAVLGLLANVCYCAAYLVDFAVPTPSRSSASNDWRWALWTAGMLFALVLENYWICDEIYPFVK